MAAAETLLAAAVSRLSCRSQSDWRILQGYEHAELVALHDFVC